MSDHVDIYLAASDLDKKILRDAHIDALKADANLWERRYRKLAGGHGTGGDPR